MDFSKYIACICEGTAEQVIINILLDNNKLIFDRKDLLEEDVLRSRSGQKFEQQYLRKGFDDKITVLRIYWIHETKTSKSAEPTNIRLM
jgi:hypothetical protein